MFRPITRVIFFYYFPLCIININAQDSPPELDVPFVRTPLEVIYTMLDIANISESDTLYDLGCGDGRIVITAAQKYGAFGIGVDIDPLRIKESKTNAAKAEIEDRVLFLVKDFFETNVSSASVVTLFIKEEMNLKLRPMLLHQLKPGSRIVSHNYGMGEWKPDLLKQAESDFDIHQVYLWNVPANISGFWEWTLPTDNGDINFEMILTQKFQKVEEIITADNLKIDSYDFKLSGNSLSFRAEIEKEYETMHLFFQGRLIDKKIEGTVLLENKVENTLKEWSAVRYPLTEKPIDGDFTDH